MFISVLQLILCVRLRHLPTLGASQVHIEEGERTRPGVGRRLANQIGQAIDLVQVGDTRPENQLVHADVSEGQDSTLDRVR